MPKAAPEGTRVILVMFELEDRIDSTALNLHEWLRTAIQKGDWDTGAFVQERLVDLRVYADIAD